MAGGLEPNFHVTLQATQSLPKQGKALAVVVERPRGQDSVANFIDDNAVVLEFGNVDAYKIRGALLSIFALLFLQMACLCIRTNETPKR